MWVNGWSEPCCDGRTEDFEEKTYKGLEKKNRRVSEAEPNTQSEEAFMIDRLGAFLIFIAAFSEAEPSWKERNQRKAEGRVFG